jgi:PAS domain S-box-containing protein
MDIAERLRSPVRRSLGRVSLAVAVPSLLVLLAVVGFTNARFGDDAFVLLTLPLALAAVGFGLQGAATVACLVSAIAAFWWQRHGYPGGGSWLGSRLLTYALIAVVVGCVAESRGALARRLRTHNELSLDLIATASYDGYFTQLNSAFTEVLGFTPEELMAQPFLEFVHPDDVEPTLAAVATQTEEGAAVFHFQNRYRTKSGSYRWLEWTSRPDETTRALIAVARDVTERKRLEERERQHTSELEQAVAERTREVEDARLETLQRLALAAEYRDDDTHQHTERVGHSAALIAQALGLPSEQVELIRLAAPLHDVGKLAISDAILLKPGRLTSSEYLLLQSHAQAGANLLAGSTSRVLQLAEEIALSHHEHWDGNGYPRRLVGEQIPLCGRIVAVADVFDALTNDRPYKRAWALEEALAEISRQAGHQFDPQVVAAFEQLDHEALLAMRTQTAVISAA